MFNISKQGQGAGIVRLQLEAPPLPASERELLPALTGESKTNRTPGARSEDGLPIVWLVVGLVGLALGAFCLRFIPNNNHSPYMDEVSQILGGRYLIERGTVYASILSWSYGSYLWPLVAGSMDILGGLNMVRAFTALCGSVMTLATVISAYRLLDRALPLHQRQLVAFGAGLLMAILPTGLGIGNFGTYDSLAGAAFMSGIALLFPVEGKARGIRLGAAWLLLFAAFLAKYIIAVYFPVICLYLMFSAGSVKKAIDRIIWFVGPLTLVCGVYFAAFHSDLLTLLSFSHTYTDLKTNDPFLLYAWQRPEIWLLALVASFGWQYATRLNKIVALGGSGVILAFQVAARPDFDYWKHSIYLIFFLAPLASIALTTFISRLYRGITANGSLSSGRKKFRLAVLSAIGLVILLTTLKISLAQADNLVNFYPNLQAAVPTIKRNTAGQHTVLTDDLTLRYYLYPQILSEQVTDPFYISYQGKTGLDAYKAGVTDRYYDVIVLDGGIGPVAQKLSSDLTPVIKLYYSQVASVSGSNGSHVEIYKPQHCVVSTPTTGAKIYQFSKDTQGFGGRFDQGDFQAGTQISVSQEQTCGDRASLKFTPTAQTSQVAVRLKDATQAPGLAVKTIKAQVYIEALSNDSGNIRVGMAAFDRNWQWHDDGFRQLAPTGRWVELTWQLSNPGIYNEVNLVFPQGTTAVYISQLEVDP